MLQSLYIQNYAIIDEVKIDFSNNLNIITGETGAGKSILMGALSLILGERADTTVLVDTTKKCCIEGSFFVDDKPTIKKYLDANDLDANDQLLIRREIATTGKSRAFINDTPVNLQQLKSLTSLLVDLHQQFDTLELGESDFQREVLDALAENEKHLTNYSINYKNWIEAKKQLEALQHQQLNFQKEFDYHQFLYKELEELSLKENELEDLEAELKILNNSEGIKSSLNKVYFELKDAEQPVITTLKHAIQQLQQFSDVHQSINPLIERLTSTHIELLDIASEVEAVNDSVVFDEERIQIINDKLSLGYKLLKKHNVNTTNDLIAIQYELEQKLQAVLNIEEHIKTKKNETEILFKVLDELAETISNNRKKQANPFAQKVNLLLQQVGMPNAILKVEISTVALNEYGKDAIEFLFDANKSNKFEPIRKVASGGELSRLMLCIKSLVAQKINLPTLIFDEIDSGISGEAAKQVSIIMQGLAEQRQIICITHQPQIAAKANTHLYVYKEMSNEKIKTNIKKLTNNERTEAIAKMLSGENPSTAAIASAKEMMQQN
ncbi:MAG: DNA repair protein RecN [Chitinophagaceae bacterium]|nr:DNA repair protein RecN [Chitinophagaceae bacterium]